MEDELVLLEGLYPALSVAASKSSALEMVLEHVARIGKVRIRVRIENKQDYPVKSRPIFKIERGLSAETELNLAEKIRAACDEYPNELCLVQLLSTFTSELDELTATCGICLDEVKDDILITEPCAHIFHASSCFADWAAQCRENRQTTAEAELNRTRRRQRESTAEAEVRQAIGRVAQLDAERSRLLARKTTLTAKVQELSAKQGQPQKVSQGTSASVSGTAASTTAATGKKTGAEKTIPEREKDDEDLLDLMEAQKRFTSVTKSSKMVSADLAAARKVQFNMESSLKALRDAMTSEANDEERSSASRIPCPICRTELDIS